MKIENRWPDNIDEIKKIFPVHDKVVITIGNTIYNPGGKKLSEHLIVHESVHAKQQMKYDTFEEFFALYINDPAFRLRMEGEAYGQQLKFIKKEYGLEKAMKALHNFALELSGKLYGNIATYGEARDLIRKLAYYN